MADHTHIEWTDATWNPVTGCSVVSAGCKHCYAMKLAGTRLKHDPSRAGLTVDTKSGPVWNGKIRFNEKWLDQPLRWRRPRRIFVCAHGDLFHESVPDEWIDRVFAVMMLAQRHTFQVLTKRPARALEYLTTKWQPAPAHSVELPNGDVIEVAAETVGDTRHDIVVDECYQIATAAKLDLRADFWRPDDSAEHAHTAWPLPNVWLGTSVENQDTANKRIPVLLATPAAVRWISAEPLLGPINLKGIERTETGDYSARADLSGPPERDRWTYYDNALTGLRAHKCGGTTGPKLDWVVAGGESGNGARPMHPDWARALRDQCATAGVPFLFKQWGAWAPGSVFPDRIPSGEYCDFDETLHSDDERVWHVSKKAAGRLLDGVQHDGYPA